MWGRRRALRGGAWNNNEDNLRVSNRNRNNPSNRNNNIGFRCARSLPEEASLAGMLCKNRPRLLFKDAERAPGK
jgi:hypothetical protein